MIRALTFLTLLLFVTPVHLGADQIRVATFNTELSRDGPGLLLRDISKGSDEQIEAVLGVITETAPDILLLQSFDWDLEGRALAAFAGKLAQSGVQYNHTFALQPNTGLRTGLDLDADGRLAEPEDAQGFGRFTGQGGMALLSRFPIVEEGVRDFSTLLWKDMPGAGMPRNADGSPFPTKEAAEQLRLSSVGHWAVPIRLPQGDTMTLLAFHAAPPVFDGPEDRNGRRNHDEILFWLTYLDGDFGDAPAGKFVLVGDANLDPEDGDGRKPAIRRLLSDHRLRDPQPRSEGAVDADDQGHLGDNALDTVDWDRVGRMRVDYVLPSQDWQVSDAGVYWPTPGTSGNQTALTASRHRLVWVDLLLD